MRSNFLSWSNLKSLGSVWVIHNAEDVTEKVDHRSSDESRFTIILEWFIFFRTHSRYLFKCCCHIIEMPVYNRTSRTDCRTFGCILAVNDAKFVRVVVKAELYICWVPESGRSKYGSMPSSSEYHFFAAFTSAA
jgi:hypothetical protein